MFNTQATHLKMENIMSEINHSKNQEIVIKKTTKEELQKKLAAGAVVINVLDPQFYNLGSIKGSIKIPVAELTKHMGELDKKKEIITYCKGTECTASLDGAKILSKAGFHASAFEGGLTEWKKAGLPMEAGAGSPLKVVQKNENPSKPASDMPKKSPDIKRAM